MFLIHRKTGLLLQHVRAGPTARCADAQMVSAMLTAIRDFAQDSFRTAEQDSLDALEVGELSVWIEQGPEAVIAAVIRGNAPKDFRRTLQDAVERVHLQFGEALAAFSGDAQAVRRHPADPRGLPAHRVPRRRVVAKPPAAGPRRRDPDCACGLGLAGLAATEPLVSLPGGAAGRNPASS